MLSYSANADHKSRYEAVNENKSMTPVVLYP